MVPEVSSAGPRGAPRGPHGTTSENLDKMAISLRMRDQARPAFQAPGSRDLGSGREQEAHGHRRERRLWAKQISGAALHAGCA
jgi:hypothetical protein